MTTVEINAGICGWARSQRNADRFFCITADFTVS